MATIFRPPVVVTIKKLPPKQPDNPVDLLALLAPNPARPFKQDEWVNPRRTRPAQKSDAPTDLLSLQVIVVVTTPFQQNEWLNPPRGEAVQKSDAPANMLALLQPNPAITFSQTDWPNCKPARLPKPDWPVNLLALLQPNPAASFRQSDWNAVLTKRQPASVDPAVNLLPLQNPPAVATLPFIVTEWLLPATRRPITFDHTAARNLPLTTAIAGVHPVRRKRYILPDGRRFFGTPDELRAYIAQLPPHVYARPDELPQRMRRAYAEPPPLDLIPDFNPPAAPYKLTPDDVSIARSRNAAERALGELSMQAMAQAEEDEAIVLLLTTLI